MINQQQTRENISFLGNDVCTSRENPEDMTSTELFYNNTLTALRFFETRLAPESHIILVGLIDAGFLWTNMANRYHPLVRNRTELGLFADLMLIFVGSVQEKPQVQRHVPVVQLSGDWPLRWMDEQQ